MNEQALRFRFGVFVLMALILLAVLTILFGGFPSYFKKTDEYTIIFNNAQGVAPGTPVRRSGVRIGEVRSVKLDNVSGQVEVVIRVDESNVLPKGDKPTLLQSLLGGESAIAFMPPTDPKDADPTPVIPGSTLKGVNPADAGSLVQQTADLVKPATEALNEIRKVAEGLNKVGPILEETVKDFREVGKMAREVGPDLQKTSAEIRALAKSTRDTIPEIQKTNDEIRTAVRSWGKVGERVDVLLKTNEDKLVRSLDRMEETLKRVNEVFSDENQRNLRDTLKNAKNASGQFDDLIKDTRVTMKQINESLKRADEALTDLQKVMKPLGDKGPTILKNVEESTDNLNKTIKDVRDLLQAAARADGTVSKLVFDPSLYNNLNDSATMVTKILPRLDRVLRDVEVFADKLARHPELIGIGGVIRPSSGSKETPQYRIYP
jgi:phospholipid/cholesterol/gamma-HCH transport system substrate-binding protein